MDGLEPIIVGGEPGGGQEPGGNGGQPPAGGGQEPGATGQEPSGTGGQGGGSEPTAIDEGRLIQELKTRVPAFSQVSSLKDFDGFGRFADPRLAAANEFVSKTGGDPFEYLQLQKSDFDQMDAASLAKRAIKADNPSWTAEQVEREFRMQYAKRGVDDNMDDDERAAVEEENAYREQRMQTLAEKQRQQLKKYKEEFNEGKYAKKNPDFLEETSKESYRAGYKKAFEGLENIQLRFGDNQPPIVVQIDDEIRDGFEPTSPKEFLENFIDDNGGFDPQAFVGMQLQLHAFERIIQKVASHEASMKYLQTLAGMKGIPPKGQPTPANQAKNNQGNKPASAYF